MRTADAAPISAVELPSLFHDLENASALILAVSGGPDSTALMLLAARWRDTLKTPPKLIAVTIDHGLRIEAKHEAAAVAKLARKLKVTHRTLRWTGKKPKTGIQQAARAARYRLLAQTARQARARFILTAHTLDDQAETVLIRLCRGSGLTGLAAMQRMVILPYPSSERGGSIARSASGVGARGERTPILLIRPLLNIPKSRLIATLKAARIPFFEDPSNRDPRFTRARLRLMMASLASEGLTAERLALLSLRLRRADAALEATVDHVAADLAVRPTKPDTLIFNAADFMQLPTEIGLRLLGRAITQTGNEGPVELAKLETLLEELALAHKSGKGRLRRTLAGACVSLDPAIVLIERAPPRRRKVLTT